MEMKKKKKLYKQWQFLVAVFVVIAVGYLIISFTSSEPHFTIKKMECTEELELIFLWNDVMARNRNITHEQILEISYAWLGEYVLECPDNIQDCFLYANKTNCEQVEADEININICDSETEEFCRKHEENYPEDERDCRKVWCRDSISKQDLSIDWLDENCEKVMNCLEGFMFVTNKEDNNYFGPYNCVTEDFDIISELYKEKPYQASKVYTQPKFKNYKCELDETYYVETWNQIK